MRPVKSGRIGWVACMCLLAAPHEVWGASAQIKTAPDGRAVAISNLVPRDDCFPSKVRGKVAKRDFDNRGLFLSGVVVEEANGTRTFANVDSEYSTKDAATVGRIKGALETLLAVGKKVDLGVYACGAAGRVVTVHSIRAL